MSLGSDLWVLMSVRPSLTRRPFADLTDVTLADEDSNSIQTDDVFLSGYHLLAKYNASPIGWAYRRPLASPVPV